MKNLLPILFFLSGGVCERIFSQQPIFATIPGGDLYSFDITNCTRHFVGSTGHGFGDIAFTLDGRLWGIISGNLYQIDTTNANATLIGNMGIHCVSLVGLNDTTLLVESGLKLYGVNNNTAASYYIDTIGFQAAGDLTWYDDDLYIVTALGKIIKMVLNSANTAIISVTPIGSSVPTCEGAVTASFVGDYNSIVGFNGPNLIKICQLDGSFQPLCPNLNIGGTPGGASIRLGTQVPQPTVCNILTSVDYSASADSKFKLSSNPFSTQLTISLSNNEQATITLYDIFSRQILQQAFTSSTTINTSQLADGIYFYELSSNKRVMRNGKVIKH